MTLPWSRYYLILQAHLLSLFLSSTHSMYTDLFDPQISHALSYLTAFVFSVLSSCKDLLSTLGFLFLFLGFEEHIDVKNSNKTKKHMERNNY